MHSKPPVTLRASIYTTCNWTLDMRLNNVSIHILPRLQIRWYWWDKVHVCITLVGHYTLLTVKDPMVFVYMRYVYKWILRVNAQPRFWLMNFMHPWALTRENTVIHNNRLAIYRHVVLHCLWRVHKVTQECDAPQALR